MLDFNLRLIIMRAKNLIIVGALVAIVVVVAAAFAIWYYPAGVPTPAAPAGAAWHMFFGMVEDEVGNPVEGVEVSVWTAETVMNPTSGGHVHRTETQKRFSVYTNARGRFFVTMPERHNWIVIEKVIKPGKEWVIDWAWTAGPTYRDHDNRVYQFPGGVVQCPNYRASHDAPAIFPLHPVGSDRPPRLPSRGGSDFGCDRKVTTNERVELLIPSAGPGAPSTPPDIERRIADLIKSKADRNASHSHGHFRGMGTENGTAQKTSTENGTGPIS